MCGALKSAAPLLFLLGFVCLLKTTQGYTLLAEYAKDYPKACNLQPVILNPPLPDNLGVTHMKPGEVLGVEKKPGKNWCRRLECSLWSNEKGEGYRLQSDGCAIVRRPKNCDQYKNEDLSLPYPECCYHAKCPKKL